MALDVMKTLSDAESRQPRDADAGRAGSCREVSRSSGRDGGAFTDDRRDGGPFSAPCGESRSAQQIGPALARALQTLLAAPGLDGAVISAQQDRRNLQLAP